METHQIPQNSLTETIERIVNLSNQLCEDYYFSFSQPLSDDEIAQIEKSNCIVIPESYKDWLRFSGCSEICGALAQFLDIRMVMDNEKLSGGDMVVIGYIMGDGEEVRFSKSNGGIFSFNHGQIHEYSSFKDVLIIIIEHLEGRL